ncbi:accessory gene regulator B [Paenibacillus sophorae]|uniref:Accessory gene regulator B n=1 Tax=Paenibacillus sophorae TaxID=1333845 RepID=A0A1H8N792_9BACL|nr:accessory gene regulator B family protein [Paenibacillus sophorae]SEO25485.1 accessory gene regulator B [Paenibacillus sophorae]
MEILSYKIAKAIKKANPLETQSIEIMQYSLSIIINTLFIFLSSAILSLFFGTLLQTITVFFSLSLLRLCSGGVHFKTSRACNLFSIFLCVSIPILSNYLTEIIWICNLTSLVIMILFAPNPDVNSQIPKRLYPYLKIASVILVLFSLCNNSPVIGLAFFIQSLTVIPLRRR